MKTTRLVVQLLPVAQLFKSSPSFSTVLVLANAVPHMHVRGFWFNSTRQIFYFHISYVVPIFRLVWKGSSPRTLPGTITCFGAYSYCTYTNHGNLLKLLVAISSVTYFIPGAHTRNWISQNQHSSKGGRGREKNEGEWTGKVEIRMGKKFLPVGEASVAIF